MYHTVMFSFSYWALQANYITYGQSNENIYIRIASDKRQPVWLMSHAYCHLKNHLDLVQRSVDPLRMQ